MVEVSIYTLDKKLKEIGTIQLETDKNLIESDYPADAKVVGEKFKELEEKMSGLTFVPIEIKSFNITNPINGIAEKHTTVNNITLSWSLSKDAIKTLINNQDVTGTSITYNDLKLTTKTTYTLKVQDQSSIVEKTTTLNFYLPIYYGVSTEISGDGSEISKLNKKLQSNFIMNINVNVEDNKYLYIAIPKEYIINNGEPTFYIGGFETEFNKQNISFHDNNWTSGSVEEYVLYKSNRSGLGTIKIEIK